MSRRELWSSSILESPRPTGIGGQNGCLPSSNFRAVSCDKLMKESARYILQILVFVALILSIGTVGYLMIEDGITASDAFYMTVTAITPTQFD